MKPILTIAVPTYNRSSDLARLLSVLHREVQPLAQQIQVLVSDNASSDDTSAVISSMATRWPGLITRRNPVNVGPDRNFCLMLEQIETRYFWIIGDDDVPKVGAIARILNMLIREEPALIYMPSEWQRVVDANTATPADVRYRVLDRTEFARAVHIWTTFISGMVIDRSVLAGADIRRYVDTFLVQLGWVLPALSASNRFLIVEDPCVVATQDNTGGYGLLTVFGANFPRIARESLIRHPGLAEKMIDAAVKRALPALIWSTRERAAVKSSGQVSWMEVGKQLGWRLRFWFVLLPLGVAPLRIARAIQRGLQLSDRLRAKISGVHSRGSRTEGLKSIDGAIPETRRPD